MQMMGSDFQFREKIAIAILGASSWLGVQLVQKVSAHPWFTMAALCNEQNNEQNKERQSLLEKITPFTLATEMYEPSIPLLLPLLPAQKYPLVFSTLQSEQDFNIEKQWADKGSVVISSPLLPHAATSELVVLKAIENDQIARLNRPEVNAGLLIALPSPYEHARIAQEIISCAELLVRYGKIYW